MRGLQSPRVFTRVSAWGGHGAVPGPQLDQDECRARWWAAASAAEQGGDPLVLRDAGGAGREGEEAQEIKFELETKKLK